MEKQSGHLKCGDINIRDPFVLFENGMYYMYGTRAANFGIKTGGFDVYVSPDLQNWSGPAECFHSETYGLNYGANWAPEVHKYKGAYYMFATFVQARSGLRGTYILKADSPLGPFRPHSNGPVTPDGWECLDGTLYISRDGRPYIVFCHEHTQIIDGTICFAALSDDLSETIGEPVTMFRASSPDWADELEAGKHYITDGPFLYRSEADTLFMIWSTFIQGQYAQCLVKFDDGELGMDFAHLPPITARDGGHGMIFSGGSRTYLVLHSPNKTGSERPVFHEIEINKDTIAIIK